MEDKLLVYRCKRGSGEALTRIYQKYKADLLLLGMAPAVAEQIKTMDLSDEAETELGKTIQNYLLFTRFFKGQGEWTYRGRGVTLGEKEAPIFWYRPRDSETYRVIYGDLHVEDVIPEDLPQ